LCGTKRGAPVPAPHTGETDADGNKGHRRPPCTQNIPYIRQINPKRVLIVSGDHIYRMNYDPIFSAHIQSGADVHDRRDPCLSGQGSEIRIARVDRVGRVTAYQENPIILKEISHP